jgi:hypothetical protein
MSGIQVAKLGVQEVNGDLRPIAVVENQCAVA